MRVGVVHTVGSPCRCAESVSAGLRALNHEFLLVDSAEIEMCAPTLAARCDLVIDHTDTFCGRGLYRPFVRLLLENCGARVVGSDSRACFVADNKAAAKRRLAEAGIPVPPGILVQSDGSTLPDWLRPPLVLKPAFEHMSRGLRVVGTKIEAYAEVSRILGTLRQPVLVESYIPGRELAVSILGGSSEPQVLPILEWDTSAGILTEEFKLLDPQDAEHRALPANLHDGTRQELEEMALHAFRVLHLRDYARFDLRLSPQGSIFFLEANTTPSLEPMEALAASAQWAGIDYPGLVNRLLAAAAARYEPCSPPHNKCIRIQLETGPVELEIAPGVHVPPQSTVDLANLLDVRPGEEALELGCGSGLLSIAMAKLGASRVVATDLDPESLQSSRRNAVRNSVEDRVRIQAGSWYEALAEKGEMPESPGTFDLIVATPPQTPGPRPFGPKYGGPDGTRHLFRIIDRAADFLRPEGRLWLVAISLANPVELWDRLRKYFEDVVLVRETPREFKAGEYESLQPGLFEYLRSLQSRGTSDFTDKEDGHSFRNLFIRAAKPRKT
jgi:D-alanine-D-alanine ligase-like ATP-grasp enzyme/methylase of polypeptide subunit release factors